MNSDNEITAVFTQTDKKKGRGQQLLPPPIKKIACENSITVYQPTSLRNEEVINIIKNLSPDMIIVVAYGKILPEEILNIPKFGCINLHASLLPKYRGAGPIQWSVLNGETETGVTTQYMGAGIDTGDILLTENTRIGENETASELHDRLSLIGSKLLIKTVNLLEKGELKGIPQNSDDATYAPKLTKEMSKIDFLKNATEVHNLIRGLSEWPCATVMYGKKRLKIYKSMIVKQPFSDKEFVVACGENTFIKFCDVQIEGSKRMTGEEFLRGHKKEGLIL
ncbi:MAG: methionyl-tRNA formyltransferase [Oscillospiraceae bacterium]